MNCTVFRLQECSVHVKSSGYEGVHNIYRKTVDQIEEDADGLAEGEVNDIVKTHCMISAKLIDGGLQ